MLRGIFVRVPVLLVASGEDSCCLASRLWFRLRILRLPVPLQIVRLEEEEEVQLQVEAAPCRVGSEVPLTFVL